MEWAVQQLSAHGHELTGAVSESRRRQWSLIVRLPTSAGPMWAKANAPGFDHEAPLTAWLAANEPSAVIAPFAIDADRGWMLTPDGGPLYDEDTHDWHDMVRAYVAVQHRLQDRVVDLRAIGVPYVPPDSLAEFYCGLADPEPDLVPEIERWAAVLAQSGRITLEHNDLHAGNVFGDGRLFDWGDSVLTHPFLSIRMFESDWRDNYFATWREFGPVDDAEVEAARRLTPLIAIHPWSRISDLADPWAEFVTELRARLRRELLP